MAISDELRKLIDPNNDCCCEHCLSNKCKEWALKQGYYFSTYSFNFDSNTEQEHRIRLLIGNDVVYFGDDSSMEIEVEAIFKACQWILDKDSK